MTKVCRRFLQRDKERQHCALELEKKCAPRYQNTDFVEINIQNEVVQEGCEIRTLLNYLLSTLEWKHQVYRMVPMRQVAILNMGYWHMTLQSEDIFARRRGDDAGLDDNCMWSQFTCVQLSDEKLHRNDYMREPTVVRAPYINELSRVEMRIGEWM